MVKENYKDSLMYVAHKDFISYMTELGGMLPADVVEYNFLLDNEHTFELVIKKIRDEFKEELKSINLDTRFESGIYQKSFYCFDDCVNDTLIKTFVETQNILMDKLPFYWDSDFGSDGLIRFNLYDFNYQLNAEERVITAKEHQLDIGFDEFLNEVDEKI